MITAAGAARRTRPLIATSTTAGIASGNLTSTSTPHRTPVSTARRGSAALSAAPSMTGSATSSGVRAPCSWTAHGVSSMTAGVRIVRDLAAGEPEDDPGREQAGDELQAADAEPQPLDAGVDRLDRRSGEEHAGRLGADHLAVEVGAVQQFVGGQRVDALAVVPVGVQQQQMDSDQHRCSDGQRRHRHANAIPHCLSGPARCPTACR